MQDLILRFDYWLFNLINQKGSFELGDTFFPWITDLHHNIYFKVIVIPLLIFVYIKIYKKMGVVLFLILLLAVGWADFSGGVVKNHYLRLRPFENHEIVSFQKSPAGSKSFYSNHTTNIFTLATYTSAFIPALRVPLFAIGTLVGYSRVYNGVHYPTDVFAGALMGGIWGLFFASLAKRILAWAKPSKKDSQ